MSRSSPSGADSARQWVPGALLAIACGVVYLAVRPALFDYDGYLYRMNALVPGRWANGNPHHVLWNPIQILVATLAELIGDPTTVPFQILGIVINCVTLAAFFSLLRRGSDTAVFAACGVLLVAFSPSFWFLGLQNHPYPLALLALVVYLSAWLTENGAAPSNKQLVVAGLSLTFAVLLHQAVILLLLPAVAVLIIFGGEPLTQRVTRALVWGTIVAALALGGYLFFWGVSGSALGFVSWSTDYLNSVHPFQVVQLGIPIAFARSAIGLSSSLMQSDYIQGVLSNHFSAAQNYALFGASGLLALAAAVAAVWRKGSRQHFLRLIRSNAFFTLNLLSLMAWFVFAFAWEPATPHYWVLIFFPGLACLGVAIREYGWPRQWLFLSGVAVLSLWNGYFNYRSDTILSRGFPEPMLAAIQKHVGDRDIFIVLGNDAAYGGVNYEILFMCLNYSPRNPEVAILNDFVLPANGTRSWRDKFDERIGSTLNAGGRVFVASHVFDRDTYADLAGIRDPFDEQINPQYLAIDGEAVYQEVQEAFQSYDLEEADFRLGDDDYLVLSRPSKTGIENPDQRSSSLKATISRSSEL